VESEKFKRQQIPWKGVNTLPEGIVGTHERVKPRTDTEIAGNSRRSLWLTKKTTYEGKQG